MLKNTRNRLELKITLQEKEILKICQANESRLAKFLTLSYYLVTTAYVTYPLFQTKRTFIQSSNYSAVLYKSPW